MIITDHERITWDPVSWCHSSRLPPEGKRSVGIQRSMMNKFFNQRYNLAPITSEVVTLPFVDWLLKNWFYLHDACFYMACQRYRRSIYNETQFCEGIKRYKRLNLINPVVFPHGEVDIKTLQMLASRELSFMGAELPSAINQRLSLIFEEREDKFTGSPSFNKSYLMMAVNHARSYPIDLHA